MVENFELNELKLDISHAIEIPKINILGFLCAGLGFYCWQIPMCELFLI